MSFVDANLEPGEKILYQAKVHRAAYVYPLVLLACLLMPGRLSGLMSTELAITDKRLLGKVGNVYRKNLNLEYRSVSSVRAQQSLLGMACDYGSVTIMDNRGRKTIFRGIAGAMDVKLQIDEAIEMAMLGRKLG